jgi:hypothetical protein
MKRRTGFALWATMVLASSGCGGALWAAAPPTGGTVVIQPKTADGADDPSLPSFADAASAALTAKGFTIFDDPAHAAYLAELVLSRATVGTGLGKNPNGHSADIIGTGVAVALPTGNSSVTTLERTQLEIRIRHRVDGSIVWDGTAVTVREAGTRKGTIQAIAGDLSKALLESYPVEPGGVIGVP